jgi:spore coat polysaccharide biosynthesis predicted glycosyltransferase SpsG
MPDTWIFRVASKPEVGGGHISRSLAIACAMRKWYTCLFVLDQGGEHWIERIEAAGFQAVISVDDSRNWSGCLLDGYEFTEHEENYWRQRSKAIVVFDDFDDPAAKVDLAISSVSSPQRDNLNGVRRIGGPDHAIIDSSYFSSNAKPVSRNVEQILVGCGARDSVNATATVLEALSLLGEERDLPQVTVCLGARAPHLGKIRDRFLGIMSGLEIKLDQPGILKLLEASDLVIGGGGVSLLERMACGRPSISLAVAANQVSQIKWASDIGATINGGLAGEANPVDLSREITFLADNIERRKKMSNTARRTLKVDGVERVAREIADLVVTTA